MNYNNNQTEEDISQDKELTFINMLKSFETILDYMIAYMEIDATFILNFKSYMDNYFKKNKQIKHI